jgi:hypothetical protein
MGDLKNNGLGDVLLAFVEPSPFRLSDVARVNSPIELNILPLNPL